MLLNSCRPHQILDCKILPAAGSLVFARAGAGGSSHTSTRVFDAARRARQPGGAHGARREVRARPRGARGPVGDGRTARSCDGFLAGWETGDGSPTSGDGALAQALFTAILSPSLVMHVAQCTAQSFLFCSGVTGTCGTAFAWSVFSSLMMSSASFASSTL